MVRTSKPGRDTKLFAVPCCPKCGRRPRRRSTLSVSWALRFVAANGGADECYYNKCNASDLDHRQSLTEDNNTKHRRYNGVRIGKERHAHWSDHRYRNEKGDYREAVEHGGGAKADPPRICLR